MTWWCWLSLVVAALAGTTLAISYYMHWTYRFERRLLGQVSEIAFLILILALASAAFGALWSGRP